MGELQENSTVTSTTSGTSYTVKKLLGAGGQGEVYLASGSGKSWALKWYFPHTGKKGQREAIEKLITIGPPTDKFLWPIELVTAPNSSSFGYIMALREKNYKNIVDLMKGRINPSFYNLITATITVVDSYKQLHAKGLCYQDISFGNLFFNPDDGGVLICDNDNVTINKSKDSVKGVLGTPRFMAPEIVCGEAYPSTETDRYSLAVLLFYMFMVHHPLEGRIEANIKCLDLPAMNKIYGSEPIFIFDPNNDKNRPDDEYQKNAIIYWGMYPQYIRDLFIKAFTKGLLDPTNGRVVESEWRSALVQLRDSIIYCGDCGSENFYDAEVLKKGGGSGLICWSCHKSIRAPPRIKIDKTIVMLNFNTRLYEHHLTGNFKFDKPVAEVTRHPKDPSLWGLKNLSDTKWVITKSDGKMSEVQPGQSVSLASGTKLNFGSVEGEIRV
jgi:DNA-binding helix-hairpin-helix protein with protein kinase domain